MAACCVKRVRTLLARAAFTKRSSTEDVTRSMTLAAFYKLRDQIFGERKTLILKRHEQEKGIFVQQLWTRPVTAAK
jgi:hypothetical protein